jgi:hypothetical protein
MRFTTLALAAIAVAVPLGAASAQSAPPSSYDQGPPPGYEQGQQPGYEQGYNQDPREHTRHVLNHEQRAMLREEIRSQGMGKAQAKEAMHQQMQQMASMSPDQQAQARNALQARWNALPAAQKQQIEQRIAEHRERRQQQRQGSQSNQQQGPQQYGPQGPAQQNDDDE